MTAARASRAATSPVCRPRSARLIGIPITCSTYRPVARDGAHAAGMSDPGTIERALQRLEVAVAGHRRAADHVDLGALRGQRLLDQDRQRLGVDLLVTAVAVRVLDDGDVGDLLGGD